ncbi:MAG TPA: tetratricopeptide repeat protein [Gemmataceae bacterium]|nr:tetratricopeptide repeat protein [Gemmataceae bacterium]
MRRRLAMLWRPVWLVALLGVCLAAAGGGWYAWSVRQTDDLRRQAAAALDDRDFDTAQARLQAYVAARPKDGEARFLLAQAQRRARVEQLDQASDDLYQARHLGYAGDDVDLEAALLDVQENGPSPERMVVLQRYLDGGGSGEALALEALARGCIDHSRLDEATGWLNRWINRDPDDWYPHLWRGAIFEYLLQPKLAVSDFEFVVHKRPADELARLHFSLTTVLSGYDYKEALQYLEPYSQAHPDDLDALVAVARCRRMLGQADAAEALLRPVVAAHPDQADALLTLAMVQSDRGRDAEVLDTLHRLESAARRRDGEASLARLRRLEPVWNNMDPPERLRIVYTLEAATYERLGNTENAARCRTEADRIRTGMTDLATAIKEHHERPRDAAVLHRIGMLYMQLGMPEQGAEALERALAENSDDPAAHLALAEYYETRDDPEARRLAALHRQLAGGPKAQGP